MSVQRYGFNAGMSPHESGAYVAYDDYAALVTKLNEIAEACTCDCGPEWRQGFHAPGCRHEIRDDILRAIGDKK